MKLLKIQFVINFYFYDFFVIYPSQLSYLNFGDINPGSFSFYDILCYLLVFFSKVKS